MSLNKAYAKELNSEFSSEKSFLSIIIKIIKLNEITTKKVLKQLVILIIISLVSYRIISKHLFRDILMYLLDINMNMSVGLLGLLIAGFSIVMSSLDKESMYALILFKDKKKHISIYKSTLIFCMEPLILFTLVIFTTICIKILYYIYPAMLIKFISKNAIKMFVLILILYIDLLSLYSLKIFLINIYNILSATARFLILEKCSKDSDKSFSSIIEGLEQKLNESNKN